MELREMRPTTHRELITLRQANGYRFIIFTEALGRKNFCDSYELMREAVELPFLSADLIDDTFTIIKQTIAGQTLYVKVDRDEIEVSTIDRGGVSRHLHSWRGCTQFAGISLETLELFLARLLQATL